VRASRAICSLASPCAWSDQRDARAALAAVREPGSLAIVDAELLRREAGLIHGRDGLLVHANHLEAAVFQGRETPSENSLKRRERLETLLTGAAGPVGVGDVQRFYRDHANAPHSLCAHPFPGRNVQTVVSLIGDLSRLELHAAKGAPCRAVYATYTVATCRQGALSVTVRDAYEPPLTVAP